VANIEKDIYAKQQTLFFEKFYRGFHAFYA